MLHRKLTTLISVSGRYVFPFFLIEAEHLFLCLATGSLVQFALSSMLFILYEMVHNYISTRMLLVTKLANTK